VAGLTFLGRTVKNKDLIKEEIKRRFKSDNAF
jgi:hypothetical protein